MKMLRTLGLAFCLATLATSDAFAVPSLIVSCPPPTEFVDSAKESIPAVSSLPEDQASDCEDICAKKWLPGCKAAAAVARKCQSTLIGKHVAMTLASCKTRPDKDEAQACKDVTKAQKQSLKELLENNYALAVECCTANVDVCSSVCQGLGGTLTDCDP